MAEQIETDLRLILSDVTSENAGSSECKEAIQRLADQSSCREGRKIGTILSTIFNETYGIVKCIIEGLRRSGRKALIKSLLTIVSKLADNVAHMLADYSSQIMALCCQLDSDTFATQGCEIFIAIINNAPWLFHDVRQIFNLYQKRIWRFSIQFNELKNIVYFDALELMIEHYPNQLNSYYKDLWQVLLNKMHQIGDKGCHSLLLPFFKVLTKLMMNFSPTNVQCNELYSFFSKRLNMCSPNINVYEVMLPFFVKMMPLFGSYCYSDCKLWHEHFCKYTEMQLQIVNDSRHSSSVCINPIDEFYRNIFSRLPSDAKNVDEYFSCYLTSRLLNNTLSIYDADCLILWSARAHLFLSSIEYGKFLETLIHFIFSMFQRPDPNKSHNYSFCIQSVFILVGRNSSSFLKYRSLIVSFMELLLSCYQEKEDYIIHGLQICFINIPQNVDDTLKVCVHRSILQHCSRKLLKCPKNRQDSFCNENLCAYCSYSNFWHKLLDDEFFNSNPRIGLLGYKDIEVQSVLHAMWDAFIELVFYLSHTLNFDITKEDNSKDIRAVKILNGSSFSPVSSGDVTLYSNMIQLLSDLVEKMPKSVLEEWGDQVLLESIKLSSSHPYISAFCNLVIVGAKIHRKTDNYCGQSTTVAQTFKKFIYNCFQCCEVFSGEILFSYVNILLNIPEIYVVDFIDQLPSFFDVTFQLASDDIQVAADAVSTLTKWTLYVGRDRLKPVALRVTPLLASLVKIESGTVRKFKRQGDNFNNEVLKGIFTYLAYLDKDLVGLFYSCFLHHYDSRRTLNMKISIKDHPVNISLDSLIPQVFFLSVHSSKLEERLRACELLHLIGCYMIGKSLQMEDLDQQSFAELFKAVVILCIVLANDSQLMIRRIFGQFIIQCTNIFSCKLLLNELNKTFTESLLDCLILPKSDACKRSCFDCLKTLVKPGITGSEKLFRNNIELVMNYVSQNLLHPSAVHRKGAALALLSIKETLCSEPWSFDKYGLYIIYLGLSNLSMFLECSEWILEILSAIKNTVLANHQILLQHSESRILPPGFHSIVLSDIINWLIVQAVSNNPLVTMECTDLLASFACCIPGVNDLSDLITMYSIELFTEPSFNVFNKVYDTIEMTDLNELLQSTKVICHIAFFQWLIDSYDHSLFLSKNDFIFLKVVGSILKKLLVNNEREYHMQCSMPIWKIRADCQECTLEELVIVLLNVVLSLEKSESCTSENALQLLINLSDLPCLFNKFFFEPSYLAVRFGTDQYDVTYSALLKAVSSDAESSKVFMNLLFRNIHEMMGMLSIVVRQNKPLPCSQMEFLHCISLVNMRSIINQSYPDHMKKLIELFSGVFRSSNSRQIFHHHGRDVSNLLEIIFSLANFDEVCSSLFEYAFSDSTGSRIFYSQFEHVILKYFLEKVEERHYTCFGNLNSNVKMDILNKMLSKCNYFTSSNKFPACVIKAFASDWQNIKSWAQTTENMNLLLDCLNSLGSAFSLPLECFNGTEIELWIFEMLQNHASSQKLQLLIPFTSPVLYAELIKNDLAGGSQKGALLQCILSHSLINGRFKVVPFCLKQFSVDEVMYKEACYLIISKFVCFDPFSQESVLSQVYHSALEGPGSSCEFFLDVFPSLFEVSNVTAQILFFSKNLSSIKENLFSDIKLPLDIGKHLHKSMSFLLFGKMYGAFDKEAMFGIDGFVCKSSNDKTEDILLNDLIKSCYDFQRSTPPEVSHLEIWRKCQCYALNCLLVLICNAKLSSRLLQHFIFQDKDAKTPDPILETVANFIEAPHFISWLDGKRIKKRKKRLVNTGIKSSSTNNNFHSHSSSLKISVISISQDCKAFDFIRRADIAPFTGNSRIIEVDLEGDSLDSHECLPYITSAIYKTVESGITSSSAGQKMPGWMITFNGLLRNPKISHHARSFIVKIVFKCRETFKPFATHWYPPILYSLILGCCGGVSSFFFYQISKLLISWHPVCTHLPEAEKCNKWWDKLIENIFASFLTCGTEETSHLLDLIRMVVANIKGLSPPYAILNRMVNMKSIEAVEVTLRACITLFENDCPLRVQTSNYDLYLPALKDALVAKRTTSLATCLIGHFLKNSSDGLQHQKWLDIALQDLNKLNLTNKGEFMSKLEKISQCFPPIAEKFLQTISSILDNPKSRTLHKGCMTVIQNYVTHNATADVFFELKRSKLFDFFTSKPSSFGAKHSGLHTLKSFINCGDATVIKWIVNFLMDNMEIFNGPTLKSLVYEILMLASNSLNSSSDWLGTNQSALFDEWFFKRLFLERSSNNIQDKIIRFIAFDHVWSRSTQEMLVLLLESLSTGPIYSNDLTCIVNVLLQRSYASYQDQDAVFNSLTVDAEVEGSLQIAECYANEIISYTPLLVESENVGHQNTNNEDIHYPLEDLILDIPEDSGASVNKKTTMTLKLIRSYSNENLPDIRIPFVETISLLKKTSMINRTISGNICVSMINCIFNRSLNEDLVQRMKKLIPILFSKMIGKVKIDSTLATLLLQVCLETGIHLDPVTLHDVCQTYDAQDIGILLAENMISRLDQSPLRFYEISHYYYNSSVFHNDLGHMNLSRSILKGIPHEKGTVQTGGTIGENHMPTIFDRSEKFKELSLLSDWDQLKDELQRLNCDSSSQVNRPMRRHLRFQILSEINCKILNPSIHSDEPEWLEDIRKYNNALEQEFEDDTSVSFLLHNQVDKFKTASFLNIINWTYRIAIGGHYNKIQHDSKTKKLLDNHLMAVSLSEQDGSSFYSQLYQDLLYFPEDLIQWQQLIINRDYFLTYHGTKRKSPLQCEGNKERIMILRSDFLETLITLGELKASKEYASKVLMETNENNSLVWSKLHLLESQQEESLPLKLDYLWRSWETLMPQVASEEKNVNVLQHLSQLCSQFTFLLPLNLEFDHGRLRKAIDVMSSSASKLPLNEAVVLLGYESLVKACQHADTVAFARVHVKTAEFCLRHVEGASDELRCLLNKTTVECVLRSMVLGGVFGNHLLLKALNIVFCNNDLVSTFQTECCKADSSLFAFWLPQLIGYLNSEKAQILEPLFMRLVETFPQKLMIILHLNRGLLTNTNSTIKKIWQRLGSAGSGREFINALCSVCHPNLLLKSYLKRLINAQSQELISSLFAEIEEKCFFNPHQGMMVGRLYAINDKYRDVVNAIFEKKKNSNCCIEEIKKLSDTVTTQPLAKYLQLESFSPFLSTLNCTTYKFEMPNTIDSGQNAYPSSVTLISFSPYVTAIQSLRKPMKIVMLGSDGNTYPWILKYDEDLRQDQYIQQLFSIINQSMKKRSDWDKEAIITYSVVPLTPQFGLIEMLTSTMTMSSLIDKYSSEEKNWRVLLKEQQSNWFEQAMRETSKEDPTISCALAAKYYSSEDIIQSFSCKSSSVPKNLLRTCLLKSCESPKEYFHKRQNFLRSHAMLSICHWLVGVGDRHLNNFLVSLVTCDLIGIDFGFSFGAGIEVLPIPELVPFRLTPQFYELYKPLYESGILEAIMVKCLSSFDEIILLAMQVLEQLPLHGLYDNYYGFKTEGSALQHASWVIGLVKRKLAMEDPVSLVCEQLNYGRLNKSSVDIYTSILQQHSRSTPLTSFHDVVKILVDMASDEVLLGTSHPNFEPWI